MKASTDILIIFQLEHVDSGMCVVADMKVYDKRSMIKLAQCDPNSEKSQVIKTFWWVHC